MSSAVPRPRTASLAPSELDAHLLGEGAHRDPHAVLGPHRDPAGDGTVVVRALRPDADAVAVVVTDGATAGRYPLSALNDAGLFAGAVPGPLTTYRLAITRTGADGEPEERLVDDPYRFSPVLGSVDHRKREHAHKFTRWCYPRGLNTNSWRVLTVLKYQI